MLMCASSSRNMERSQESNTIPNVGKSFADVVGSGRSSAAIALKVPRVYRGEPALFFSDEEIASLSSPFQFSLIGKFSHSRPSLSVYLQSDLFLILLGLKLPSNSNSLIISISYSALIMKKTTMGSGLDINGKTKNFPCAFLNGPLILGLMLSPPYPCLG